LVWQKKRLPPLHFLPPFSAEVPPAATFGTPPVGPLTRPEEIRAHDIGKMRVGKTFDIAAPRFHTHHRTPFPIWRANGSSKKI
jgi:hypothetical protein